MKVSEENKRALKFLSIYLDTKITNDIKDLSDYVKKIDSYLEIDKVILLNKKEKEQQEIDYDDSSDMLHGILFKLGYERHLDIFTRSDVVTIYTFFEFMLNDICEKIAMITESNVKVTDFKGSGIVRSREYLEKVHSIEFSDIKNEWDFLKNFNSVRNCLSHAAGSVEATHSAKKLINIVGKTNGLELFRETYIKIAPEYLEDSLFNIDQFLTFLSRQVCKQESA